MKRTLDTEGATLRLRCALFGRIRNAAFLVTVQEDETVGAAKQHFLSNPSISTTCSLSGAVPTPGEWRLRCGGNELDESQTLAEAGVRADTVLGLVQANPRPPSSSAEAERAKHFCWRPPPTGAHAIAPHEAFNQFTSESILILDVCSTAGPKLPGSAWCDAAKPLLEAAAAARAFVMAELTPDQPRTALLLHDDEYRAAQVSQWLLAEHCQHVYTVARATLAASHPFLFEASSVTSLPVYPNEIVPGQLYLGSAGCVNARALGQLRITHVVSLLERTLSLPAAAEGLEPSHLLCHIADAEDAQLAPVLRRALPFIAGALSGGGRVLVHCERGASRSVAVVCAQLMVGGADGGAGGGALGLADALALVKAQRPCAQPNVGFVAQLDELDGKALAGGCE